MLLAHFFNPKIYLQNLLWTLSRKLKWWRNKNKLKRKYKNAVEQEYLDIYNKKPESIEDRSKLLLFKTLKTEYKLEFYLK
jgi:hypothetical protein